MALPAGAVVGTSSIRRVVQVKAYRGDLDVRPVRGNVDTRLRKLEAGEYDCLILAGAGLERLGLADRITEVLEPAAILAGGGAKGVGDPDPGRRHADAGLRSPGWTMQPPTAASQAERACLAALAGAWHRLPLGLA